MESYFGANPWDFGTGFTQPPSFDPGNSMPVQPQVPAWPGAGWTDNPDPAGQFAAGMAKQGIRPEQFMQDPQGAVQKLQPPGGAGTNPWDATAPPSPAASPQMPSATASLDERAYGASPTATDASAAASPADAKGAKGTFGDKLAETLKGVKAPPLPTPQTVRTPSSPDNRHSIKAGELMQMLLAMQPPSGNVGLKLPSTLGTAVKGTF